MNEYEITKSLSVGANPVGKLSATAIEKVDNMDVSLRASHQALVDRYSLGIGRITLPSSVVSDRQSIINDLRQMSITAKGAAIERSTSPGAESVCTVAATAAGTSDRLTISDMFDAPLPSPVVGKPPLPVTPPPRCTGMFCPAAMENLYYIAHNAAQALELRGFNWQKSKKKKKKTKKKGKKKKE